MTAGDRVELRQDPQRRVRIFLGTVRKVTPAGYVIVAWDGGGEGMYSPRTAHEQLAIVTGLASLPRHVWHGQRQGGDPAEAGSAEWVSFCQACGVEQTDENEFGPCTSEEEPMGQAFDREGNVLAEATGETKREVLDELLKKAPDAHEIRISKQLEERDEAISRAQRPSVARNVHYVAYGTPGGEYPAGAHRAAIITEVNPEPNPGLLVGLCVLNPTGQYFNRNIEYDPTGTKPGTWHWPERV